MTDLDGTDLRATLERSVGDLRAPALLDSAVLARGRRRRAGRRAVFTGGIVATTALVATAAWTMSDTGSSTAVDPATHLTTYPAVAGAVRPASVTPYQWAQFPPVWQRYLSDDTDRAWEGRPASDLLHLLEPLLPDDVVVAGAKLTSSDHAPGESDRVDGSVTVTLRTRTGELGALEVMLRPPPPGAPPAPDLVVLDEDGTPEHFDMTAVEPVARDHAGSHGYGAITIETAERVTDQGSISVSTANTTDEKWSPGSRVTAPRPLLTLAQVRAIAASGVWTQGS